jgi:hypothetical protein
MLYFKSRTNQPLGTLPQFLVTLGEKTIFIDVMVVHDPLDLSLLLGQDYVYAMKAIVSTIFHVKLWLTWKENMFFLCILVPDSHYAFSNDFS